MSAASQPPTPEGAAERQAIVDELIQIGIADGVFHLMALDGQLLELKCETPRCYCDQGRTDVLPEAARSRLGLGSDARSLSDPEV